MANVIVWDRQDNNILKHVIEDMLHTPLFKDNVEDLDPNENYTFVLDTLSAEHMKVAGYDVTDLREYKHPKETTYIFGENSSKTPLWEQIRDKKLKGDVIYLQLPTKRILHSETACSMVLYDRYVKEKN